MGALRKAGVWLGLVEDDDDEATTTGLRQWYGTSCADDEARRRESR